MKQCVEVKYDKVGRVYVFDDGTEYYSVTTMLGHSSDHTSIDNWERRVGEKAAAHVTKIASHLGEEFHLLGENYLLGKPLPKVNIVSTSVFKEIIPILDAHITKVHSVEQALVTDKYQLAGRTDAVVDWDNELMILDFKLLNTVNKTWLTDYWCQTAIYAQCWYEMYGVKPQKTVLVIGDKTNIEGSFFLSRVKVWEPKVNSKVSRFRAYLRGEYE